ncbi:MAG TPA: hypothetical protein VJ717_17565 [Gemmatimonadaceae bacterium]|nr:hypothetical protein [Gemmatimonadaceae bacterium]
MKRFRFLLGALAIGMGTTAYAAHAARVRAVTCGPWQHCLCRSIGCSTGGLLCMMGEGVTCYQAGLADQ